MKKKDKRYTSVCYNFCHAAWNKRNKTWYVRTNIGSPVKSQLYCGVYKSQREAAYVAKYLNRVLEVVSGKQSND